MRVSLLAAGAALALSACDSLDTFDVPTEGTTTIAGNPIGGLPYVGEALELGGLTDFRFTESKAWKDNDLEPDDVESVKLKSLKLKAVSPEMATLDFLDEITVFIEAPGLEKKKIAEKIPVPDGVTEFALDVPNMELKRYATSDEMGITTVVAGRQPGQTTVVHARAVFEVNAAVF